MAVIEKHYELVDKPSYEVTRSWKVWHIIFYTIATLTGLTIYYAFNSLKQQFGDNCFLFPNITFLVKNISENTLEENKTVLKVVIDESKTRWGNENLCDFCQYVPIMSMIVGSVFLTFFVMCPRGGSRISQSGIKRPWHIVLPSIFLTGIFSIIILTSTIITRNGIDAFCGEFERELNTTQCTEDIQDFSIKSATFHTNPLIYIKILNNLEILCVATWFIALILLFLRCCTAADFKLIEITISSIESNGGDHKNLEETEVLIKQCAASLPVTHV